MRAEHLMSGFGIGPYLDRCWFVPLTVLQGSSTTANQWWSAATPGLQTFPWWSPSSACWRRSRAARMSWIEGCPMVSESTGPTQAWQCCSCAYISCTAVLRSTMCRSSMSAYPLGTSLSVCGLRAGLNGELADDWSGNCSKYICTGTRTWRRPVCTKYRAIRRCIWPF